MGTMVGVNVGCLEEVTDVEFEALIVVRVDGLHDRQGPPEHGGYL